MSRHSWLLALIVLLGVGGYLLTSTTIRHDRDAAAERRARVEAVHAQEVLGRARAYVGGLADVLAREPEPGQARFARWAGATSASVGLNDVLWVERVPASERKRYEHLRGVPITRLTVPGGLARAPAARSYLPATFTSRTRPELRPGVDVTGFPGLDAAIHDRARIFAVGASAPGRLGAESGFYLLEAATFAGGRASSGYLVAFVPRGWFSTTLGGDPRRLAISEDGKALEGHLDSVHGSAGFEMLGRNWRVDVGREPSTALQSLLPWLALAWPFAVAAVVAPIGRAISLRRRAQRDVERIYDLSLDMMAIVGFDGRYRLVNPAFERTLGYTRDQIVARPFADLVHPDDLEAANEAFASLLRGDEVNGFECRFLCADGSERWLQWSARVGPEQGVVYGTARDVTERRRIDAELREAQRTAEAQGAELEVRAGEQAALRRVATLVAREVTQPELFSAIADEIGQLVGADEVRMVRYADVASAIVVGTSGGEETFRLGSRLEMEGDNVASRVLRTERTARLDDYERATGPTADTARSAGIRSAVAAPIIVEGRLWGAIIAASTTEKLLPPETELRLGEFTDLMATAIANAESRARADRLADEQAALRRVATLVAERVQPAELFSAVSKEIGRLFGTDVAAVGRFDPDGPALVVVGLAKSAEGITVGSRFDLDDSMAATGVYGTARSSRIDGVEWSRVNATICAVAHRLGAVSTVSSPIVVEDRLWGAISVAAREALPAQVESRLEKFTELVATAIANAESREALRQLADEQAALRRVATLVAEGVQPAELFSAVTQEVARLFVGVEPSLVPSIIRFDPGPEFVLVGAAKPMLDLPVGSRWGMRDLYVSTRVLRTGRSARVDATDVTSSDSPDADLLRRQGFLYQVGSPIVVEGRLWGAMTMNSTNPLPPDSGQRLESFTELVATAIANAESREGLAQLADEQSSLRRVATLVAEGASPAAVLDAVAAEMERVLRADAVTIGRYESGEEVTVVAHRGSDPRRVPPGTRVSHQGENVMTMVRRTEHSTRMEHREGPHGTIADLGRTAGVRASVGAPIVVDGRLWGAAVATWRGEQSPPADTEERMAQFTQLLDTAIANADSRGQLHASRARLVTEADEARRRVVRDLHDGAQQRLVHTVVTLRLAQQALGGADGDPAALISEALQHAQRGNVELRELAHGILPGALTHGGLRAGVDAVASRLDLPVHVDVPPRRFPAEIERSAYFIVAESLTNIVKHADARHAQVKAVVDGTTLHVEIRDDGIGGADPHGHGLVGIDDRVSALGGQLDIESPPGGGTLVHATLPLSQ